MLNILEVHETNQMIEQEKLDVRTITMGIDLMDCVSTDLQTTCDLIYNKITSYAKDLVSTGESIERDFGIPIVNKRITVTPWKPPAMNGLSSGALQNATNFTQPYESMSAVASAISLMMWPSSSTEFMSMPVFVEPTFTDEQTMSVSLSAAGSERMSSSSAGVIDLETSAE